MKTKNKKKKLTAVSLAFPVQNLMIAVASGTGVGINALLSRCLGEKDYDRVNKAARNGIFLEALGCLLFVILGLTCARFFYAAQTNIEEIVDYGTSYVRICTIFSMGIFGQVTFERLLQSTGKTFYAMITQGVGAIINIILDPILIFGLFGFPRLEVAGAALATVIGQVVGATVAVILNKKKNHEIQVSFKKFRPDTSIIKNIYAVGLPSIIMISIGSIMTFGVNKILIAFSSTATAVFGVYFKLQSFVFMPIFGLTNGMVPILAYNYGARRSDRIAKTIKLSVIYAICIMVVGFVIFQVFTAQLLGIFSASDYMLEIGVPALRTISLCFVFAGYCIVSSSVFQALGEGILSLLVSLFRQLVVLLPCAYLLSRLGGLSAVWWAFPLAEIVSLLLCTVFLARIYRNKIRPLGER